MKAAENKRLVMVGIFIFLALMILVIGILTLGGQQNRFGDNIRLLAVFDNTSGLKRGNNVWFSGVKVGTVKDIRFFGKSQVEVSMLIDADAQKYIRKDAKVRLGSESMIGNKIVEIMDGSPDVPAVEDQDRLLVEKTIDTDDILVTFQENNKNLVSITDNLKTLSNQLVSGQGTIGAVLTDTMMADNFRSIVASLQQASATTVKASAALSEFTSRLNNKNGLVNDLLTDTVLYHNLTKSAEELQKTIATTNAITENLNKASSKLNTSNNTAGMLLNDEEFSRRLKSTMLNLETSTKKFDENMEALQHNFLLKGYFKKNKTKKDSTAR